MFIETVNLTVHTRTKKDKDIKLIQFDTWWWLEISFLLQFKQQN